MLDLPGRSLNAAGDNLRGSADRVLDAASD
jgi:hypothetical protein